MAFDLIFERYTCDNGKVDLYQLPSVSSTVP
jgi:hypothetical protein